MRWHRCETSGAGAVLNEQNPDWWRKPRRVHIVVDNPSWLLPYVEKFVDLLRNDGDDATLFLNYSDLPEGDVAMFLGCIHIANQDTLQKHRYNLVVHESDLPAGKGFSPLTWQVIEGASEIPIRLIEAVDEVDAGPIYEQDVMVFQGHELIDELRETQGLFTIRLCQRFLDQPTAPTGIAQVGEASSYPRRGPEDSQLDADKTIASQFNLLRTVDNQKYPAFFEMMGERYYLTIAKEDTDPKGN